MGNRYIIYNKLYKDELFYLQIDSHSRFIENWDEELITMVKQLQDKGYNKPLLTGYVSSYDPENDPDGRVNECWSLEFDRYLPEGPIFIGPNYIENLVKHLEPGKVVCATRIEPPLHPEGKEKIIKEISNKLGDPTAQEFQNLMSLIHLHQ